MLKGAYFMKMSIFYENEPMQIDTNVIYNFLFCYICQAAGEI